MEDEVDEGWEGLKKEDQEERRQLQQSYSPFPLSFLFIAFSVFHNTFINLRP
jgi:hypothetical protein